MTTRRIATTLGVMAAIAVLGSDGCFATGPQHFRFIVPIDTIVAQDTVKVTDSIFVHIKGVIAYDGCAQFHDMTRTRTGGTIQYAVYADHDDRRICVQGLILFNRVDTVLPPQVNPTVISAVQPKGAYPATDTVVVR